MAKTGGGRGTNQYQVKGRAKVRVGGPPPAARNLPTAGPRRAPRAFDALHRLQGIGAVLSPAHPEVARAMEADAVYVARLQHTLREAMRVADATSPALQQQVRSVVHMHAEHVEIEKPPDSTAFEGLHRAQEQGSVLRTAPDLASRLEADRSYVTHLQLGVTRAFEACGVAPTDSQDPSHERVRASIQDHSAHIDMDGLPFS
ncbi:MAG: hypothetical protein ACRD0J_11215 [Acidimicrobiales bacterium]